MRDRINLLPREHYKPPQVPFNVVFFAVVGSLTLILGLLFFFQDRSYRRLQRERRDLSQRIGAMTAGSESFKRFTETMQKLKAEQSQLEGEFSRVRSFQQERTYFSDVLRELTFIVPEGLWLTEVKSSQESGGPVRGLVLSGRARYNHAVAGLVLALERSRFFQNIFLNFSKEVQTEGEPLQEFEITTELKS